MAKKQSLYYPSEDYLRFVPSDVLSKNKKRPLTQRTSMDYLRFIPQNVLDSRKPKEEEGLYSVSLPEINVISNMVNANNKSNDNIVPNFNIDLSKYTTPKQSSLKTPKIEVQDDSSYTPVSSNAKQKSSAETSDFKINMDYYNKGREVSLKNGIEPPDGTTLPEGNSKALTAANILSGISGITSAIGGFYGAKNASEMQQYVVPPQAKIEPAKVEDRTSAQKAAGEEDIDKAIRTAAAQQERLGLYGGGILVGKETEAKNRLAGTLAGMQLQTDAQNAQLIQQADAANVQLEQQRGMFNAEKQNEHQFRVSQLVSQGLSGVQESLMSSAGSIAQNLYMKEVADKAAVDNEITRLNNLLDSAYVPVTEKAKILERIKQLTSV